MPNKKVLAAAIVTAVILGLALTSIVYLRNPPQAANTLAWRYDINFAYHEDGPMAGQWLVDSARVTVTNHMQTNITMPWVTVKLQDATFSDTSSHSFDELIGNYTPTSGFNPPYNIVAPPEFSMWADTNSSMWPTFAKQPLSLNLEVDYFVVEFKQVKSDHLLLEPRQGYVTPSGFSRFEKSGEGLGCYSTGFKGSIFPDTYVEWDTVQRGTLEVDSRMKLGESPFPTGSFAAPGFAIFVKAAYWHPQPELPEDSLGFGGSINQTQPPQIIEPLRFVSRVMVYGQGEGQLSYEYFTRAVTANPDHWYDLRIIIKGDKHFFFVDGQQISSIVAHVDYGKRTAFGVFMGSYSYGCFGNWYVKSSDQT